MGTTWERVKAGMDKALEVSGKSAKILAQKAGETARITKLSVESMTLEHQMSKKFAELGNIIYGHARGKKKTAITSDLKAQKVIGEIKKLEDKLNNNHRALEKEKKSLRK